MITELPIQGLPTGKRPPYVIVSASDTPDFLKKSADYICDGVDDQVEIQQAINKIASFGGTIILLPGTYKLTDSFSVLNSNVNIYGLGKPILEFQSGSTSSIIWIGNTSTSVNNIIIENIEIKSIDPLNLPDIRIYGISDIEPTKDILISNLTIYGGFLRTNYVEEINIEKSTLNAGFDILNTKGIKFTENFVYIFNINMKFDGCRMVRLINNHIDGQGSYNIHIGTAGFTISNNFFGNTKLEIYSNYTIISNNNFTNTWLELDQYDISVVNNIFSGSSYITGNYGRYNILNNIFNQINVGLGSVIQINSTIPSVIKGNIINASSAGYGIYVINNNIISDNIIMNCNEGIYMVAFNQIVSNSISGSSDYGIYTNATNNIIIGNYITSCKYGIYLDTGSQYNYVGKNIITNSTTANISDNGTNNILGLYDYANNKDNYA